jgi:hypothetical protein
VLRNLFAERAGLLDLQDEGRLTDVGGMALAEIDRAIDHWERAEREAKPIDRLNELREITGELVAIHAKLARGT